MRRTTTLLCCAASLPFLAIACGGGSETPSNPAAICTDGHIIADTQNNYAFTSTITLDPVTVKPMADLTFNWGGVTKDFLGHAVDPVADLDTIVVMLWGLP